MRDIRSNIATLPRALRKAMMSLQDEILARSTQIKTDSYPMSIGELISLYKEGEIDVHPEFQRIYRWSEDQKTRLIESLLLGIPIPPIFVAQRKDGVWDVVDGVQRISTIFQFVGVLRDENGKLVPPLVLQSTKYLKSLGGKVWNNKYDEENSFTRDQQLYLKRARVDINIVLKESDEQSKYELFMRLNTGGSPLSGQEVRNCLLVMAKPEVYEWLRELSDDASFKDCIAISDRAYEEQYHMELLLRFLIMRKLSVSRLREVRDIGEFLDDELTMVTKYTVDRQASEEVAFRETFSFISRTVSDDAFRKYDPAKRRFVGGFSISAFEAVALGIGFHQGKWDPSLPAKSVKAIVQQLWQNAEFRENSGSGVRASSRIPHIVPLGRRLFGEL